MKSETELFCHAVKSIRYRFNKVIGGSKDNFGYFRIADSVRTPNEIINHMYELIIKTQMMIKEGHLNCPSPPTLVFQEEARRFLSALDALQTLVTKNEIGMPVLLRLLQGPIIDVATHIGQLALLNGLNGNKILRENYYAADIE